MAQGLRTRQLGLGLLLSLLVLPIQGCSDEREGPGVDDLSPAELLAAVLEYCHGPLQGGMERSLLDIQGVSPEGIPPVRIALWLPDLMRVDGDTVEILRGGDGWRCPRPGDGPTFKLDGAGLASLVEMRDLLRGLLLIPLYEMQSVKREGSALLVELGDGERWYLELRDGSLLPASLRGPPGEIRFLEYVETSVTRLPRRASLGELGERQVRLRTSGIRFEPFLFADPETQLAQELPQGSPREAASFSMGADRRPASPEEMQIPAAFWLEIQDPGDWQRRAELVKSSHRALYGLGQTLAGFTGFVEEGQRTLMVIPFFPDQERGSRPFVRREDQVVRRLPEHRALVVYPPEGAFAEAVASGTEQLERHALRNLLETAGPVRVYPYIFLGQRVPTAEDLASVIVRLELPIR